MTFVGMIFGVHYLILSAIPSQYSDLYGLDEINLGLVYIPCGFGSILPAFTTRCLANWNYKRHATRLFIPHIPGETHQPSPFPDRTSSTGDRPSDSLSQQRSHQALRLVVKSARTLHGITRLALRHRL